MTTNHPYLSAVDTGINANKSADVNANAHAELDASVADSGATSADSHANAGTAPLAAAGADPAGNANSSVSALSVIGRAAEAEVDPAQDWLVTAYHEAQTQDARRPGGRMRAAVHAQAVALARAPRGAALPPVAKAGRAASAGPSRTSWTVPVFASIVLVGLTGWLLVRFDGVWLDQVNRWAGRSTDAPTVLASAESNAPSVLAPSPVAMIRPSVAPSPVPVPASVTTARDVPATRSEAAPERPSAAVPGDNSSSLRSPENLAPTARPTGANSALPAAPVVAASPVSPVRPAATANMAAVDAQSVRSPVAASDLPAAVTAPAAAARLPANPPIARVAPVAPVPAEPSARIATAPSQPVVTSASAAPRPADTRVPEPVARRAPATAAAAPQPTPAPRRPADAVVAAITPPSRPAAPSAARAAAVAEATADLLLAARNGRTADLEDALARGALINAPDASGRTALILAAANSNPRVVRRLLAAGVNPALVDGSGADAMEHARRNQAEGAVRLIQAMR